LQRLDPACYNEDTKRGAGLKQHSLKRPSPKLRQKFW
jgi:hypothetical protein